VRGGGLSRDPRQFQADLADGTAMQALLEGTLDLQDGCLVVKPAVDSPPDASVVPVFRRKYAEWNATRDVLT
jgi:hypothetical protein